jgi:WD40 repeat protein
MLPEKVLDAPGLVDDYYLNLLDWSSKNHLAVGLDKSVYIWNAETGTVNEFCHTADDDYVASLEWAADGSFLAVGTALGDTQIWDVDSLSKIRSMRGHTSRVGVLSWNKHILSSGSRDGSIWNHDVRIAQHKVGELLGHTSEVCGLEWRPDGNMLASGGNDNLVQIWDARSSMPRSTKTHHMAAVKVLLVI